MKKTADITKLKSGGFIIIDDVPCKIDKVSKSTSGKHGAAKVRVDAIGLLDNKRRSIVKPSGDSVYVPIVDKRIAQVLSMSGNRVQLMDVENYEVFELEIPEEIKDEIKAGTETSYFIVAGEKTLKRVK